MRTLVCLLLLTLFLAPRLSASPQSDDKAGKIGFQEVGYANAMPTIDGHLDAALRALPERSFNDVEKTSVSAVSSPSTYRLAYNADGLYLYLLVGKPSFVARDRAYQNGDGFHMLLSIPTSGDSLTKEFLVMGFSPLDTTRRSAFVWYRNVDLAFTRLTSVRCAVGSDDGKTAVEMFLPWRSVRPYHPWLLDSMGFNLCYVEASAENAKTYHYARLDEQFQMEQRARLYVPLPFGPPPGDIPPVLVAALQRNHLAAGEMLRLKIAGSSPQGDPVRVSCEIVRHDSQVVVRREMRVVLPEPPQHTFVDVGPIALAPGEYIVRWRTGVGSASGEEPLTVLPSFDRDVWLSRLHHAQSALHSGSVTTMRYLIDEVSTDLTSVREYDSAREVLGHLSALDSLIKLADEGQDPLAHRTGIVRRAYRSEVDGILQPYTVQVPASYSAKHPYPLLVYLHGSGQGDQGHFDPADGDEPYIRLAPNGRGTSTAYSTDHAQDDIREAILDVCRNYAVDSTRIVLSGFSMGGYGVYRTQFESPNRFCALAIFSGSPDLASRWLGEGHPDFTHPSMLKVFKGRRMFIFHGGRDRNCPVEQTDSLVAGLRNAGALVKYHREEETGHESPGPAVRARYQEWLREVMEQER